MVQQNPRGDHSENPFEEEHFGDVRKAAKHRELQLRQLDAFLLPNKLNSAGLYAADKKQRPSKFRQPVSVLPHRVQFEAEMGVLLEKASAAPKFIFYAGSKISQNRHEIEELKFLKKNVIRPYITTRSNNYFNDLIYEHQKIETNLLKLDPVEKKPDLKLKKLPLRIS